MSRRRLLVARFVAAAVAPVAAPPLAADSNETTGGAADNMEEQATAGATDLAAWRAAAATGPHCLSSATGAVAAAVSATLAAALCESVAPDCRNEREPAAKTEEGASSEQSIRSIKRVNSDSVLRSRAAPLKEQSHTAGDTGASKQQRANNDGGPASCSIPSLTTTSGSHGQKPGKRKTAWFKETIQELLQRNKQQRHGAAASRTPWNSLKDELRRWGANVHVVKSGPLKLWHESDEWNNEYGFADDQEEFLLDEAVITESLKIQDNNQKARVILFISESLNQWWTKRKLTQHEAVTLLQKLERRVAVLHRCGIAHQGIAASRVIVWHNGGELRACLLPCHRTKKVHPNTHAAEVAMAWDIHCLEELTEEIKKHTAANNADPPGASARRSSTAHNFDGEEERSLVWADPQRIVSSHSPSSFTSPVLLTSA